MAGRSSCFLIIVANSDSSLEAIDGEISDCPDCTARSPSAISSPGTSLSR